MGAMLLIAPPCVPDRSILGLSPAPVVPHTSRLH